MKFLRWIPLLTFAAAAPLRAQGQPVAAKVANAARVPGSAPHIDGLLNDSAWSAATVIGDFIQKAPNEGGEPSEPTEVRILYDDDALYIGARMHRKDARNVRASITRRDGDSDAEVLAVSFDSYYDHRTAYTFAVSSGGVRKDFYHPTDFEDFGLETQFDPVWTAKAHIDSVGWTAEMRIPFSQMRFSRPGDQVWGLEIHRSMPDKHEDDWWVLIPKAAAGYASRFGTLRGISGVRPSRRLEILPYTAAGLNLRSNLSPADPFNQKTEGRAGADMKMGLGPNLTLDATVNPDFGQVEADPAVVNLTAFETVFDERRPFFVEGSENLTGRALSFLGRPTYFYSRRIGAPPHGSPIADFVQAPNHTTILSAGKITGRLPSGLTVGVLASVTPREWARTYDTIGAISGSMPVEPPAGYGVVRLQQEIGTQHSTIGATLTDTHRSLSSLGGLNGLLAKNAVAGGTDWRVRFEEGKYELTGWAGFSQVSGDPGAINQLQTSSAHYFQRPDQDHVSLNPASRSLSGYTFSVRGDKNAGRFTLWGIQVATRSPGFDINDLGQMRRADAIDFNADFQLRDTKANKAFQYIQLGHSINGSFNFGGARLPTKLGQSITLISHKFLQFNFNTSYTPRALSDEQTRGGPLTGTPWAWAWTASLMNQAQARVHVMSSASYSVGEFDGWNYTLSLDGIMRLAPRWQAEISPNYSRTVDPRQYVATAAGGPAATYGQRYVFATIERSELSMQLRLNYAFTPDLTLEGYAEPFAASGRYSRFGELPAPRRLDLREYGTVTRAGDQVAINDAGSTFSLANPDFGVLSFRSSIVLRWEWKPGSTFFLIWQQNRGAGSTIGNPVNPGALWDATRAAGDHFLAIKVNYWLGVK